MVVPVAAVDEADVAHRGKLLQRIAALFQAEAADEALHLAVRTERVVVHAHIACAVVLFHDLAESQRVGCVDVDGADAYHKFSTSFYGPPHRRLLFCLHYRAVDRPASFRAILFVNGLIIKRNRRDCFAYYPEFFAFFSPAAAALPRAAAALPLKAEITALPVAHAVFHGRAVFLRFEKTAEIMDPLEAH